MAQAKGQQAAEKRLLPTSKIRTNTGQIPGLPRNPRLIRDERFGKLKQSIVDFPDMLELREVVVFPWKRIFVCVGGNMRFVACKDLKYKDIPAKILPAAFPVDKLREFAIKDNVNFGQDDLDIFAKEWLEFPVLEWGAEIPDLTGIDLAEFFKEDTTTDAAKVYSIVLNYQSEAECDEVKDALLRKGDTLEAAVKKLLRM